MLTDRFRYSAENCSIARTLDIVGEKWTFLVLREAFYGIRRFADFHLLVPGSMSVREAHARTGLVENAVRAALPRPS